MAFYPGKGERPMDWGLAVIWLGLAVLATLISVGLRLSVALTEILVGVAAGALLGEDLLQTNASWVAFLAGVGSVLLTLLAGEVSTPMVRASQAPKKARRT